MPSRSACTELHRATSRMFAITSMRGDTAGVQEVDDAGEELERSVKLLRRPVGRAHGPAREIGISSTPLCSSTARSWFFGTIDQVRHSKGDVPISRVFDTQFAFPPKCPPSRQHFVGHARFSIANCILS